MKKRIVIVGGVAGGASAAARARRLSEDSEITVLERGPYVSFANCGLPYHIGKVIKDRGALLLHTPKSLKERFNLDVRVRTEAVRIDREKKEIQARNLDDGSAYSIPYDSLILSPGAEPFRPPIPGLDLPNVFTLKTIPDMDAIMDFLGKNLVRHATVVGGGFIGIEAAENLRHRGLEVTLVEREPQVMPPMDPEMAALLHQHLRFNGVDLKLGSQVTAFSVSGGRTAVSFASGSPLETDLVIFAIGVRPETRLAKEAGLKIGARGGIVVDPSMRTTDPDIFAVGDAVETLDRITGEQTLVPLAGPANRQGRIAAENCLPEAGVSSTYRGTQGTWICKVFDLTCAQTGLSEKSLKKAGKPFRKTYVHPSSHAGYYPNAFPMTIKMIFQPSDGRILGVEIVGSDGVDKRIDVFSTAIAGKMAVSDLVHLELAYAPPFGSAKDPVNMAGMAAENLLNGLHAGILAEELGALDPGSYVLFDVRSAAEYEAGHIPGAVNLPIDALRESLPKIPGDKETIIYCQVGFRGFLAERILRQSGFKARNLIGGYKTWSLFHEEAMRGLPQPKPASGPSCTTPEPSMGETAEIMELDACGLQCPGPLLKMREKMESLKPGQFLRITATDPGFPVDAVAWCNRSGNRFVQAVPREGRFEILLEKTVQGLSPNVSCPLPTGATSPRKGLTMVVFSNDLDRAYATFIIANGAAAMGMEVTLFFTFWGLNILRKKDAPALAKSPLESMFGMMMPRGPEALGLSKMHFAGLGTAMMKHVMSQKNVTPLPELIRSAREAGVKLVACSMSMGVMGIKKEELEEGVSEGGVAAYLDSAADSNINLFI